MSLWITLVLMGLTALVSFETGRRYQIGLREKELERIEKENARRGTVRLRSMIIRR